MNKLVFGNLIHRPLRSVISALAVAIEVIMILSIVGIMYGILNGSRDQQSGTGFDMIARPGQGSSILATSSASASVKVADVLRGLPHVQVVSPVAIKINLGTSVQNVYGIDYATYDALRPFVYVDGKPFQAPFDMLVDDIEAANNKLHVGQQISQFGHNFRICGIVEHGKGARRYIPLDTLDTLDGSPGKASSFLIRTESAPRFQEQVRQEIHNTDGLKCANGEGTAFIPYAGTHSSFQYWTSRCDRNCRCDRLPCDLPINVHSRDGANAGDRHPEEHGRGEGRDCFGGAARDRAAGRLRRDHWHCHDHPAQGNSACALSIPRLPADGAMDGDCDGDYAGGFALRRNLPGVEGRAQGSDRRPCL